MRTGNEGSRRISQVENINPRKGKSLRDQLATVVQGLPLRIGRDDRVVIQLPLILGMT